MSISRRGLLAGTALTAAALAHRQASAAPPLTPRPRGDGGRSATRHNAWLEVDAAGFESNLRELRRQVGDLRSVCLVVKADAYGHGLDLLMPSIRRLGIAWLGITSTDEARVVRAHGFRGRILRLRVATADEVGTVATFHVVIAIATDKGIVAP